MVNVMKIVKGDTVYLRSGKDRAGVSRLRRALGLADQEERFQERLAEMPMEQQIAEANKDKGVRGEVIRVLPKDGKVVVRGLNMITKHQRPRATGGAAALQQGGLIKMEAPIPISRVMLVCPHCDAPTRVTMRAREDTRATLNGQRAKIVRDRVCKQCGEVIDRPTSIAAQT